MGKLMELDIAAKLGKLLDDGTPGAKEQAALAIGNLASNPENKVKLMELDIAAKLGKLLDDGTPGAKEQAARAIGNLKKVKLKELMEKAIQSNPEEKVKLMELFIA